MRPRKPMYRVVISSCGRRGGQHGPAALQAGTGPGPGWVERPPPRGLLCRCVVLSRPRLPPPGPARTPACPPSRTPTWR